jgi:putative Mg2+ transporter-C (MgtC) family protein
MLEKEIDIFLIVVPKIVVATICGFIIGYDREIKNKVAGIRTNVLITVGCTILTVMSCFLSDNSNVDPTRILGQIVTGIGFLGAGVIMKNDDKIVGVTTAAFIWIASSIGIFVGLGYYLTPIVITLGLILVSMFFEKIEKIIKNNLENKK